MAPPFLPVEISADPTVSLMQKPAAPAVPPLSALVGLFLATFALTPDTSGQTIITYTDTQVSTTARTTTPANPLTFDIASGTATENGVVSGTGSLTKTGAGFLRLGATNTYSGGTFLSAGTIELNADNALGTGAITITGGGLRAGGQARSVSNALFTSGSFTVGRATYFSGTMTLTADTTIIASNPDGLANGESIFGGPIVGNFGVTVTEGAGGQGIGSGDIYFSGTNTYTGGTTLSTRLLINSDAALGAASGALTMDGGTLRETTSFSSARNIVLGAGGGTFVMDGSSGFTGTVSGSGGVTLSSGVLLLNGALTYTGATVINGGSLKLGNSGTGSATPATSDVTVGAAGTLYFRDNVTYGGVISGAGQVGHELTGTTVLTGTNTYTGGTTVNGGALQLGNGGTTGSIVGDVALSNGGNLVFKRSDAVTYAGVISGNGSLTQFGTGTGPLTLTGTNTYTGGTIISGGILAVSNDNQLGSVTPALGGLTFNLGTLRTTTGITSARPITMSGNGAIEVPSGQTTTLSGGFTAGAGTLVKTGTGTLTLTLANSTLYTGTIYNSGGTINLNPSADLTYAGTISGSGNFTKSGASTLTLTNGSSYLGFLTLAGGTLSVDQLNTSSLSFASGTLRTTTGITSNALVSITNNTSGTIDVPSGQTTTFGGIAGFYNNGILTKAGAGTLTLTGPVSSNGSVVISAGTLNLASSSDIALSGFYLLGSGALVKSGSGTLTIAGNVSNFSGPITVTAGTLTFSSTAFSPLNTTLTGALSGSGNLTKSGSNTLTLSGDLSGFSGNTTISSGTLNFSGNTSSTSPIVISAGALGFAASTNFNYDGSTSGAGNITKSGPATVTLTGDHSGFTGSTVISAGTLNFNPSADLSYGSAISGAGTLSKSGTGTLTLTGTNTYSGGTILSGGILAVSNDNQLGSVTPALGGLTFSGGTLQTTTGITSARPVTLTSATTSTIEVPSGLTTTLSGGFTAGAGNLTKTGTGTLTLSGATLYTGHTTISAGTLNLSPSVDLTYAGGFSGISGNLIKSGASTLTLTGANSSFSSGSITLAGGTLSVSNANQLSHNLYFTGGTLRTTTGIAIDASVTVNNGGGTIDVSSGQTTTFSTTSGIFVYSLGTLTKAGAGTLVFSDHFSSSGPIVISAGTLNFAPSAFGSISTSSPLSGNGALLKSGAGPVTLSGNLSGLSGPVTITAGTLTLASVFYTGDTKLTGGTLNVSSSATYTGALSGSGNFTKSGTGPSTFTLSGDLSAFSGNTTISAGTLVLSSAIDRTYSGALSGSGNLTKAGSNTLTLSGDLSGFSGNTTIAAGTLALSSATALQNSTLIRNSGDGTLNFPAFSTLTLGGLSGDGTLALGATTVSVGNNNASTTFAGAISGTGGLVKNGSGTLTLSGANTYSGGTTISFGSVRTSHVSALGTGAVTVSGATSVLNLAGTTIANPITVQSGGSVQGTGGVGAFTIASGGNVSPGNSPGTLTAGATTFGSGGSYTWQVNDASPGGAGATTGWDLLSISGALNITATSGSPFTIALASLTSGNLAGSVINFNSSQNSSYTVATASGGIGSFNANQFVIDATGFSNATNGGTWSLAAVGNNLNLNFTASAIPEPSTYAALAGACALGLAAYRKRRRR